MNKRTKCEIAEFIGEAVIGLGVGTCLNEIVLPRLDKKSDKIIVYAAGVLVTLPIGHLYARSFYRLCDLKLGTDFVKEYKLL